MLDALEHMHNNGVVHRDLKLENILLDSELNIKMIDFGLSKDFSGLTHMITMSGSPYYIAPEVFL